MLFVEITKHYPNYLYMNLVFITIFGFLFAFLIELIKSLLFKHFNSFIFLIETIATLLNLCILRSFCDIEDHIKNVDYEEYSQRELEILKLA